MADNYWQELVSDFEIALKNDDQYDVIIKAGEGHDVAELRAHSFVLRARSKYFNKALSSSWSEKDDDGHYIFKKPNISPQVFQLILKYLYTGVIKYDEHDNDVIMRCLVAADELGLEKLVDHGWKHFLDNPRIYEDNPVSILEIIYQNDSFTLLADCCFDIISSKPEILFSSERFPLLDKAVLTLVLQRDDLNMKEVDIWDSVLRWAFARYLIIGEDDSTSSAECLKNAKQTIKEHIPLIDFKKMSKEEFYIKVHPYKDLFPADLLGAVLRYHALPNTSPILCRRQRMKESLLINSDVFALIKKWIRKEDQDAPQDSTTPYTFRLLLRGTRDGFCSDKFHELCDNRGATLVVARIKDSRQIVGGYNPLYWSSLDETLATTETFLFRLDPKDLDSAVIGRFQANCAIYNNGKKGPAFGYFKRHNINCHHLIPQKRVLPTPLKLVVLPAEIHHDLFVDGSTCTTWGSENPTSYADIGIPPHFSVDEYEVFKVVNESSHHLEEPNVPN